MKDIAAFNFMVGVAIGKLLLAAVFSSPLFRNLALASAATFVCVLYSQRGVEGLLDEAHSAVTSVATYPDFARGLALGAALAFLIFGIAFRRRLQ
jgi:hypothetical protein